MNNKGQSLIAFILILPVIFVFTTGLWEIGNISYINNKIKQETISIIKYGLKHIEEENINEKIHTLLDKNIEGNKEVKIETNEIIITINYKYQNLYSKYIKPIEIKKTYIGKKENDKITIEEEG